ncbi:MAG: zinc-finger domain-containing protein [Pontixanthobacter sp.]
MSIPPQEIITTTTHRVSCDGASAIRGPNDGSASFKPAALGHPKVYLEIDEHGYVDCGYCDRRFVLQGGPADGADQSALHDIPAGGDPGHR